VIDTGLAQIYQSHLDVAEKIAAEHGVAIRKTLLDGKAFQKILNHARKIEPWLLVVAATGVHSASDEAELGSNTENLFRNSPCDVLLTTRLEVPELDVKAEESIRWTVEAEARMQRVPPLVQGIARTAIFRLAVEKGHSVITSDLLDEAMDRYMPKGAKATTKLAESIVLEHAKDKAISICRKCGVSAVEAAPVVCAVCGGSTFQVISPEMVEQIIEVEGGAEAETTYDGRKLTWTRDAKRGLWTIQDGYKRRRTKGADREGGTSPTPRDREPRVRRSDHRGRNGSPLVLPAEGDTPVPAETRDGKKLIARDDKKNPVFSDLDWAPGAVERILRVPAGFMRNRTQQRIEDIARERGRNPIDLALVEEGIEQGRKLMEEMIQGYKANPAPAREAFTAAAKPDAAASTSALPLNEVGIMAAMEAKRQR